MPRYFQSTGVPAHDHELDELWRLYDALAARLGSASADGSTAATGGATGAGTGTVGTDTGTGGGAGVGVAAAPGRSAAPAMTPAGTRQRVTGRWSDGGYVALGDIVTIYSPGEFEGDLLVDGTVVIMPAPTGVTLGATMATMIGPALPALPE